MSRFSPAAALVLLPLLISGSGAAAASAASSTSSARHFTSDVTAVHDAFKTLRYPDYEGDEAHLPHIHPHPVRIKGLPFSREPFPMDMNVLHVVIITLSVAGTALAISYLGVRLVWGNPPTVPLPAGLVLLTWSALVVVGVVTWFITYNTTRRVIHEKTEQLLRSSAEVVVQDVQRELDFGTDVIEMLQYLVFSGALSFNDGYPNAHSVLQWLLKTYALGSDSLELVYFGSTEGRLQGYAATNTSDAGLFYTTMLYNDTLPEWIGECPVNDVDPVETCSVFRANRTACAEAPYGGALCAESCGLQPDSPGEYCKGVEEGDIRLITFRKGSDGVSGAKADVLSVFKFDPRRRPWFLAGAYGPDPVWTKPYRFTTGEWGITASIPVWNGSDTFLGTAAVDYSFKGLNPYLLGMLRPTPNAVCSVATTDWVFIGASLLQDSVEKDAGVPDEYNMTRWADSSVIRHSYAAIHDKAGGLANALERAFMVQTSHEGKAHIVLSYPVRVDGGMDLIVTLVLPYSDLMGQSDSTSVIALVFAVFISVVCASIVYAGVYSTLLPLAHLVKSMQYVAIMALDDDDIQEVLDAGGEGVPTSPGHLSEEMRSDIFEVAWMQDSFRKMVADLREYRQYLPQSVLMQSVDGKGCDPTATTESSAGGSGEVAGGAASPTSASMASPVALLSSHRSSGGGSRLPGTSSLRPRRAFAPPRSGSSAPPPCGRQSVYQTHMGHKGDLPSPREYGSEITPPTSSDSSDEGVSSPNGVSVTWGMGQQQQQQQQSQRQQLPQSPQQPPQQGALEGGPPQVGGLWGAGYVQQGGAAGQRGSQDVSGGMRAVESAATWGAGAGGGGSGGGIGEPAGGGGGVSSQPQRLAGSSSLAAPGNSARRSRLAAKKQVSFSTELALRRVGLLVTNIRGFHAVARATGRTGLIVLHTRYLADISGMLSRHRGVIHDFQGDRVSASFNAVRQCPGYKARAVECALQIADTASKIPIVPVDKEPTQQQQQQQAGMALPPSNSPRQPGAWKGCLDVNQAVYSGRALCGNVGSSIERLFDIIGEVGTTVRCMERAGCRWGVPILTDRGVAAALDPKRYFLRAVVTAGLRRSNEATMLFSVVGSRAPSDGSLAPWAMGSTSGHAPHEMTSLLLQEYNAAVQALTVGDYNVASAILRALRIHDGLAESLRAWVAYCQVTLGQGNPPPLFPLYWQPGPYEVYGRAGPPAQGGPGGAARGSGGSDGPYTPGLRGRHQRSSSGTEDLEWDPDIFSDGGYDEYDEPVASFCSDSGAPPIAPMSHFRHPALGSPARYPAEPPV